MNSHTDVVVKGSCRQCGEALHTIAGPPPVIRCLAECQSCHYTTVLRDDPFDLPIHESLEPYFSQAEINSLLHGLEDVRSGSLQILYSLVKKASTLVEKNRTVAIEGLMKLIDLRDEALNSSFTDTEYGELGTSGFRATVKSLVCQTLYILLSERGQIRLPTNPIPFEKIQRIVGDQIYPLLSEIVTLAKVVIPAVVDKTGRLHWENGMLRFEKLKKHALAVESVINLNRQEKREKDVLKSAANESGSVLYKIIKKPVVEAIILTTDVDVALLLKILSSRMQFLIDKGARRHGNKVFVGSDLLESEMNILFSKLTLTFEKVARYRVPSFFDTGPLRVTEAQTSALISETAAINWSSYYPCFKVLSPKTDTPIYVTSLKAWQAMMLSLSQGSAYLLQQLDKAVARDTLSGDKLSILRVLIRKTHQEIELKAGRIATEAGWLCKTNVERIGPTRISCGEIDLLAAANVEQTTIILVAEVKNSDNPMYKPGFIDRMRELIKHAENQLNRKGDWVAEHWEQTVEFLQLSTGQLLMHKRRILARVIITARPIATHNFIEYPGTSLAGFRSIAHDLLKKDHEILQCPWRIHIWEVSE